MISFDENWMTPKGVINESSQNSNTNHLEKENRYLVRSGSSVVGALTEKPTIFEMFDCPQCGCQNAVGIYEQPIEDNQ